MRVIGKTEEVGKHTATISGTLPDGKGDTHYVPLNLAPVGVETVEEIE